MLEEFSEERERSPRRTGRKVLGGFAILILAAVAIVGGIGIYLAAVVTSNVTSEADMLPSMGPTRADGTEV